MALEPTVTRIRVGGLISSGRDVQLASQDAPFARKPHGIYYKLTPLSRVTHPHARKHAHIPFIVQALTVFLLSCFICFFKFSNS